LHDQQPVEAATMVEAAREAYLVCQDDKYLATLRRAKAWFHGENSLRRALADVRSGACCDGLHAADMNLNQGAESTLAFLWTEVHDLELPQIIDGGAQSAIAGE
jgi:hypothetical protein